MFIVVHLKKSGKEHIVNTNHIIDVYQSPDGVRFLLAQSYLRKAEQTEQYVLTGLGADVFTAGTLLGRITATGKWYVYNVADTPSGTGTIKGILMNAITTTDTSDYPCQVLLRGEVDSSLITIDGSDAGSGITKAIKDTLRGVGIDVVDKTDMNDLDTQD